jgi:hypothetical protein
MKEGKRRYWTKELKKDYAGYVIVKDSPDLGNTK